MWNKAKIMRQAERVMKRTTAYRKNRSDSSAPEDNYQLDYVLINRSKPAPYAAIAYAHYEDEILLFDPLGINGNFQCVEDWAFSFDGDLFYYLQRGYELVGMSPVAHCAAWGEIEQYHDGDICSPKGMQKYLNYCKKNGVTVGRLQEVQQYDGMDVMKLYDKSTFREKPSQCQER